MTKFPEDHYECLNLTELKSNIEEKHILGYSINYTVNGLLFFGGFKIDEENNTGVICNDSYLININNEKAKYENLLSKINPPPRCYHNSCTLLDNHVVIFGGLNSECPFIALNDLWIFNSTNKTFLKLRNGLEEEPNNENDGNSKDDLEISMNSKLNEFETSEIDEEGSNDDSFLDDEYVRSLNKYIQYNVNKNNTKNNNDGKLPTNNVPLPRYYSSLDIYIVKKKNAEIQKEEKDEIVTKDNKIFINNANNYEYFSLIIFGGYGGYDRTSFNDLYEYNILNNEWILRSCKGNIPSNRYGHISFINGNNLFILGGTNAEVSFTDMYSCDLKKNEWAEVDFSYSFNASKVFCKNVLVESIDRNIIFIFGGYNIISDEKGNRKIEYGNGELNMLKLYDTFKLEELKYTIIRNKNYNSIKNVLPITSILNGTDGRINNKDDYTYCNNNNKVDDISNIGNDDNSSDIAFCSIAYDFVDSNLIISDSKQKIYIMNINKIIGPKYAIFNICPNSCDINGNKKILLKGKGFTNEGKILVKYQSENTTLYSEGIYINENHIYTISPNAKDIINNNIFHVQLSINDKCYTTNSCSLEYYYNIDPKNTLIFGSGLLEPICLNEPNIFFLVARNSLNENKKIGGDKFKITIIYEHENKEHQLQYKVYDINNGIYIVKYLPFYKDEEKIKPIKSDIKDTKNETQDMENVGDKNTGENINTNKLIDSISNINDDSNMNKEVENMKTEIHEGSKNCQNANPNYTEISEKIGALKITVKVNEENICNSPFTINVFNKKQEKESYVRKFINNRLNDLITKAEPLLELIKNKNMNTNNLIKLNISIEQFLNKFSKSIYDINIIEQYMLYGNININNIEQIIEKQYEENNVIDAYLEDDVFIDKQINDLIEKEKDVNQKSKFIGLGQSSIRNSKNNYNTPEKNASNKEAKINSDETEIELDNEKVEINKNQDEVNSINLNNIENEFLKLKNNEDMVRFIDENKIEFMDYIDLNSMKKLKSYITLLNNEETNLRNKKSTKRGDANKNTDERNNKGGKYNNLHEEYLLQNNENKCEVIRNLLIFYYKLRYVCICKKEKELTDEFIKEEKESIKKLKLNYRKFANIKKNLDISSVYSHNNGYEESLKELENTKKHLIEIKDEVKEIKHISDHIIKIDNVEELNKDIENLDSEINEIEKLWLFIKKKEEILNNYFFSSFKDLNVEEFDIEVKKLQNDFRKIKVDKKHDISKEETLKLKETIKFISVLSELKKKFIKERHIKEIENNINEEKESNNEEKITIQIDDNTLTIYFYKLNVMKYQDIISEVIIKAYNEKLIEETIDKFQKHWEQIYFKTKNYKNDIILAYIDDNCIDTIEEHQITLQNCFSSKYFLFFSTELNLWQKKISNIYEVIQLLKDIEKLWAYLQNMYIHSEEVKKELPLYSKFFLTINDEYLEMLKQVNDKNTKIIDFSNEPGVIDKLEDLKVKLCKSEKPLNEYLDSKRKSFPRFFFISSTDLIDILSNGNNFKLVNTHIQKIFLSIRSFVENYEELTDYEKENEIKLIADAISNSNLKSVKEKTSKNLRVQKGAKNIEDANNSLSNGIAKNTEKSNDETETIITKFISSYGEEICNFYEPLNLKGKVEYYLNDIISHIKHTLKYYITNLFKMKNIYNNEKDKWIDENNLAQVFILCNTIFFVNDVETILSKEDGNILEEINKYYKNHILQLERVIKKVQKPLTVKNRIKIMCIITLDTFYRDVLEVILKNKNTISPNMFYWQSQIRIYPMFKKKKYYHEMMHKKKNMKKDQHNGDSINPNEQNENEKGFQSGGIHNGDSNDNLVHKESNRVIKDDNNENNNSINNSDTMSSGSYRDVDIYKRNNNLDFKELYIKIKIMDCSFDYSYDYIGNYQRLVITPLTSRIYITATQALSLYMGCAPAGPAGTGKTETTKDLSSFFGKNCYVFNCSDQLDYKSMGNIFKGIGSTGCWCCFDEFNRLIPEVLSVCSIQFKSILDCKRNNKKVCIIGSNEIIVKKNCAVFITMNPDYLGRSKLPESLKILFRPITVIIPDFNKICENMLMAEGYVDAKYLSIKFTTFFELIQNLLKDKHCDWGLRSIKSVLTKAGILKRAYPDADENKLLYSAIHDINIAKISSSNCSIFSGLLNDIFFSNQEIETDEMTNRDTEQSVLDKKENESNSEPHSELTNFKVKENPITIKNNKNVDNNEDGQNTNLNNNNVKNITMENNTKVTNSNCDFFKANNMEKDLMEICKNNHLFGLDYFVKKIIQLHDIINIRHCVFIMGEPGCGKTTLFNMLLEYQKKKLNLKTVSIKINPKAINIDDLYGSVHMKTREWKDGVFSKYMRNYSKKDNYDKAYIIFDGNLDSHWIENMNSVMDDNKVLTLSSNERILLKNHMNLVFEFSDLMFTTPATISRAGLVYFSVDPNSLWKNYFLSWIDRHDNFNSNIKKLFEKLMYKYVEPTFSYLNTLQTSIKVSPMSHIQSLSSLLDILLKDNNFESIEHYFIYSVIWCFGSFLGEKDNINYKKCFDKYWKNNFKSIKVNRKISVFDFYVENNKFKEWDESEICNELDNNYLLNNDIFVETVESCAYKYISKLFLKSDMPILFIGKTGVGKTQLCKKILSEEKDNFKTFYMIFNYYTTSKNVQALMQSCLEKKSGKQFSPPYQQKLIYFIDDINMPKCDDYNTQSAIELLCQYIDTNSWFDLEKLNLITILNTKLLSCMNYNRGNFTINPRLLRHFFILNINFPENNTVNNIFSILLKGHFNNFKQDVADIVPSILKSTISLYYNIEKIFKRTAMHFYYEFNLRDIHSIIKGLLTTTPNTFQDCDKLLFLWLHECERVYSDKLNREDKKIYKNIIIDIIKKMYNKYEINKFVNKYDNNLLLFSNFHKGNHDKCYDQCKNIEELTLYLSEELNEYNNFYNLNIVLFNDAIKHICKLIRIIDNLKSDALLLGIGGCGKTTISKFSSYVASKTFIEMDFSRHCTDNDIKKYLQNIFHRCVMKNEDIILFLKESKIHDNFFIYINEYMCTNNIIDLYTKEEKDCVINNIRNIAKSENIKETDNDIFDYYIKKVNENLHFILCFSPTSNNFRDKANNFQCILNNTMIDIYDNWEADSLMCVGKNYVNNIYMNINTGDIILNQDYINLKNQNTAQLNTDTNVITNIENKTDQQYEKINVEVNNLNQKINSLENVDIKCSTKNYQTLEGTPTEESSPCTTDFQANKGIPKGIENTDVSKNLPLFNKEEYVNLKDIITEYLKECYEDILDISSDYYSHERSHIYITPKLYLESIKTYHIMLLKNITNINNKMNMLKNGITKMNETSSNVEIIKNCLKEKKKVSEEKKEAAEKYAIDIGNEKMIVKQESELADIEEKNCLEIQTVVLKQQEECENDIVLGIPLIEQAEEALNTLNKKNIQELKTLNKPPPGVEDITAAVMQLLATIDTTISVDKFGKIRDSSWKSAQKMMINPEKFISLLKDYKNKIDENLVPDCNFKYVENLIKLPHFNKNAIQKKSKAAAGLAEWVLNITSFYKIIQNILPKRILLDNTKRSLEEANEKLQTVREKVQSLKEKLNDLINRYERAIYERDLVILEEKKLKTKLELSIRLIDALSSEQISWSNQYESLKKKKKTILTDILLSSTFVTFCGGFTKKYRNKIMTKCVDTLNKKNEIQNKAFANIFKNSPNGAATENGTINSPSKFGYPSENEDISKYGNNKNDNNIKNSSEGSRISNGVSSTNPKGKDKDETYNNKENESGDKSIYNIFAASNFNLDLLINEEILSKLSKQGLTLNSVCIENNIILENSEKFPIIIDPQMESLKWLINNQKEKSAKLIITDINDKMLYKQIEECISYGYSIIIENADEYIDNTLYNVISKNIIKRKSNYYININDKEIIFHPDFYIILHTQLSNPHYQPEIQSTCSLINFTVTPDDLEEHLLSITLQNEFNQLYKKKKKLSLLKYDYMCQLSFLQSSILQKLTDAKGDILEDVSLIENLEKTKLLSENIVKKSEIVKSTEVHINTIINLYRPLSKRGVMYFFILQKLKNIHHFYFYSLEIFLKIFIKCLHDCSKNSFSYSEKSDSKKMKKKKYKKDPKKSLERNAENNIHVEAPTINVYSDKEQENNLEPLESSVDIGEVEDTYDKEAEDVGDVEGVSNNVNIAEENETEEVETKKIEEDESKEIGDKESNEVYAVKTDGIEINESDEEIDEDETIDESLESEELENDDIKNEEIKIDKNEVEKRVSILINMLIVKMWMYIDKGLLEKDKLIVKCLIMLNLEKLNDKITQEEEAIFINPKHKLYNKTNEKINNKKKNENIEKKIINKSFINEELYEDCKNLENLKDFENLIDSFENENMAWKQWLLCEKVENEELPRKFNKLKDFSKLLLIRILRKDRFLIALKRYIEKHIKMTNEEQNKYSLENILEEYIDNKTPVLFLLTPGNDPSKDIENYIEKLRRQKNEDNTKKNINKKRNNTENANNDNENDDTINGESRKNISYINISMGQGQESVALKYLEEISKVGGYIYLQNIHLMTKWLKEFEEILDKIISNAHKDFRLFLSSTIPFENNTQLLPEKLLKKCFRVNNEKSYSLKENIKCCLDKFENKEYDTKIKTVIFGLSYYHSLLSGRFLYGKIGFSRVYSFNDNDLEISFNIIKRYLSNNENFPLADVLFLVGEIIYGGHITDIWDRRINKTYIRNILKEIYKNIININEKERNDNGNSINKNNTSNSNMGQITNGHRNDNNIDSDDERDVTNSDEIGDITNSNIEEKYMLKNNKKNILFEFFRFPDCSKYNINQLKKYIDEKLNKEQTYLLGLHINAEIEYMKNECSRILQNLQELGNKDIASSSNYKDENKKNITGGNVNGQKLKENEKSNEGKEEKKCNRKDAGNNDGIKIIYDIINTLLNELPEKINIDDLKIDEIENNTFVVIAIKEAENFNKLIECVYDTLIEIKLVLDGILNGNDKIQNTIRSLLLHNIPEIWKKYSYPSKKKLMPWFENFKLRIIFIKEWIEKIRNNIYLPNSVWLSALFNPISFLTAIKQMFAHKNNVPIDKLKLKWHVTNITKVEDINNKNNSLYIHGLFLQGASWLINSKNDVFAFDISNLNGNISYGNIIESVPKNAYFSMPVLYVYCITNEQDEILNQTTESKYLNTPLYVTSDRGNTFVCSVDLNLEIDDTEDKWILAGVALVLSDD
ncbi:dynein heavy chain, putative [Plasmodium berghei]|uniref:Dynein heavy chain, putative n=2 Tax=Plasmodium berghei TaxID=5821 RepID=A0A509AM69_PLABA|nr:dynein heavy chain, putative [Plasmodium berghei ANKA]SCM22337.1 dynein heavy chain, putative [Plasmodium berghei]SCN25390.1 dynein heavy chain, putative [Plasmodium berghei]SCO62111.1 dynein heavy chain, putative [Plasmodium berghei]VUC55794.1 dynein heavy chain, putative [Plasmodium berghei ANKA]|eukprot:XP_034421604.1 dynein heavy chain, putative [Plasmodium berghei ANKA]